MTLREALFTAFVGAVLAILAAGMLLAGDWRALRRMVSLTP